MSNISVMHVVRVNLLHFCINDEESFFYVWNGRYKVTETFLDVSVGVCVCVCVCVCVGGGGGGGGGERRTFIYVPISTDGSGTPTTTRKTGCPV